MQRRRAKRTFLAFLVIVAYGGFMANIDVARAGAAPASLVRKLYGHADARLARERVRAAFRQAPPAPIRLGAAYGSVTA